MLFYVRFVKIRKDHELLYDATVDPKVREKGSYTKFMKAVKS